MRHESERSLALPRVVRMMVRSGSFSMPPEDDERVRRADGGLSLDLDGVWKEADRQQRRAVLLVVAPRSGATTALGSLGQATNGPVRRVRCHGPHTLEQCLRALDTRDDHVLVDDAHQLGPAGLAELMATAAQRDGGARVAVACRREAVTPELSLPALLEVHLDPLRPEATESAVDAWVRRDPRGFSEALGARARRDPAALAVARRPPLLQAAATRWDAGAGIDEVIRDGRSILDDEAMRLGLSAPPPLGASMPPSTMIEIEPATVDVGSPEGEEGRWDDESPVVTIDVPAFRLAATPVTNAQYAHFLAADESVEMPLWWDDPRSHQPDQPVVGVSRRNAERCAAWAGARLPSESEWERACRAGSSTPRYGELDDIAWHAGNSGGHPHAVGERAPNRLGLHDMLGNAWEWAADDFFEDHSRTPRDGSPYRSGSPDAPGILRGGTWADSPRTVRAATRLKDHPGPRYANIGFRLAQDL